MCARHWQKVQHGGLGSLYTTQFSAQAARVGRERREGLALAVQLQRAPEAGVQHPEWGSKDPPDTYDSWSFHVISQKQDTFPNMPQASALGGLTFEALIQTPTMCLLPASAYIEAPHCGYHPTEPGNQAGAWQS